MDKKTLRWWVLVPFVLGVGFNTQAMGKRPPEEQKKEEHKLQADTTRKGVTYEEAMKELIEEDTSYYRPKVPLYIDVLVKSKDWHEREGVAFRLGKARDMRALDALMHALIHDERPIVRTNAAGAIAMIEKYNNDTTALSVLREALNDSVTNVKFHAARILVSFGDTVTPLEVLATLARGENIENWTADWGGYMGLEYMTEEDIKKQKKRFRVGWRKNAIRLLGRIGTEEAFSILSETVSKCGDETIQWKGKILNVSEYAREVLDRAKKGGF